MEDKKEKKLIYFLAALCLFLSAVENAIPKPLPFMRIGLANLPVILGLFLLPYRKIFSIVIFKIFAQGIISGTLFSYVFIFSAGGSFASAFGMILIHSLFGKYLSAIGICLFGAMVNNFAQLILSRFFLFGENTKYVAPLLLLTGLISGLILGLFVELFMRKSRWFSARKEEYSLKKMEALKNE
ncbi:MAG: Gx transporter family protein [Treponema sp.]|nr:Gx transporter family protein [Treponema sp.]